MIPLLGILLYELLYGSTRRKGRTIGLLRKRDKNVL